MQLIFIFALCFIASYYAGFLRSLIDGGNWFWLAMMLVWPVVLAWFVGDEEDRKDFYKIMDWIAAKLRIR